MQELQGVLDKGYTVQSLQCLFSSRGRIWNHPWHWINGDAARAAVLDTLHGLCDRKDKRNLVPLYRVLGEYEMSRLSWEVSLRFVGASNQLQEAYAQQWRWCSWIQGSLCGITVIHHRRCIHSNSGDSPFFCFKEALAALARAYAQTTSHASVLCKKKQHAMHLGPGN